MGTFISRSDLFEGEEFEGPPPLATHILNAAEEPIYKCPRCGNLATEEECDCIGAEPDCVFCRVCHCEFRVY